MTVRAPLRTTTERQAAAASRAAATRAASSAEMSPSSASGVATPGAQPRELAGMRRQDGRAPLALPPAVHRGQRSERLGVEHDRRRIGLARGADEQPHQLGGGQARPQPGSHDDRIVLVVEDLGQRRLRVDLLDVVLGQAHRRGLDDLGGEQGLERFGHGQGDQPGAGPTGGAADEQGGARVVERAGDHQDLAERALVATLRALGEQRGGAVVVELDGIGRERLVARFRRATGRLVAPSEPEADRPAISHAIRPSDRAAAVGRARSRSSRARIRRSRSSSLASMSSGKR